MSKSIESTIVSIDLSEPALAQIHSIHSLGLFVFSLEGQQVGFKRIFLCIDITDRQ
jgi:hypothetical protein